MRCLWFCRRNAEKVHDYFHEWYTFCTPYGARRFTASAFEAGRCHYGHGTRKKRKYTVNSVLGHVSNTNADEQYLTMQLENMPVLENLSLKLAEFHPYEADDDLTITKGCYLIAK